MIQWRSFCDWKNAVCRCESERYSKIGYLSERKRIEVTFQDVHDYCAAHQSFEIVTQSFVIDDIPELHDRLIAGTAYAKHAQLMTNDPVISRSRYVSVVW